MKLLKPIFFVLFTLIIASSCKKDNNNNPTSLSIRCLDIQAYPVPGVDVSLYSNYNDYINETNAVAEATTDNDGYVTFSGAYSQVYYFDCYDQNDCLLNWDAQSLADPLPAHQNTNINVILTGFGTLSVTNTSPSKSDYQIKVNGEILTEDLHYGNYITDVLPLGTCTVEAIQIGGSTDVTYAVTISQCQTVNQNIP